MVARLPALPGIYRALENLDRQEQKFERQRRAIAWALKGGHLDAEDIARLRWDRRVPKAKLVQSSPRKSAKLSSHSWLST
jgi:hypothetical protein